MSKIFWVDLETTGVDVRKNDIHHIAIQIELDGMVLEELDIKTRPDPKAKIEPKALQVGGVTLEQVKAYQPAEAAYKEVKRLLDAYVDAFNPKDKFHLAGYNNRQFDDPFLRAWFQRRGDNFFGSYFWSDSIDVLVLASQHLMHERHKMPSFKLSEVAAYLGIDVDASALHDANYDLELTRLIYEEVTK